MKKYFNLKSIGIGILLLLVVAQFFRINKENPPLQADKDFLSIQNAPADIQNILKTSCYDCHSNLSQYPWYTNVAPVSWWIKHHINEGREHLNFSEWGFYSAEKADHKLEECVEMVEEGEMPMSSYTLLHGEASLNEEQKLMLVNWFSSLRNPVLETEDDKEESH